MLPNTHKHTPSSSGPADSERAESEGRGEGVRTGHREGKSAERRRSSVSRSRRGSALQPRGEEETDTEEDLHSDAAGRWLRSGNTRLR